MSAHANALPRWAWLCIPLVALAVLMPMFHHGLSCGHDVAFHGTNWFEAAQQWRQGIVYPRWVESANYNAGEPRFIFYPPASWMLGAALGTLFGWPATPFLYIFLVMCAAGFAMYRFARLALWPAAAMAAALFYMANPYTLFVVYTRSAYSELLAAAILPLLFLAVLRPRVHIALLAEAVAALWLSSAPGAVLGMYSLLLLALLAAWRHRSLPNLGRTAAGTALGMGVAAIYILPAAYERKWVQIALVKFDSYDFRQSFLFGHIGSAGHLSVLHRVSLVGLIMFAVVAGCSALLLARRKHWHMLQKRILFQLMILAAVILFLQLPISTFAWAHVPELAFLQFPWRWLAALAPIFGLLAGATLSQTMWPRLPRFITLLVALVLAVVMSHLAYAKFKGECDPDETPARFFADLKAGVGQEGTDEYTPVGADTDDLQPDAPRIWLYPAGEIGDHRPAHHHELPEHAQITSWSAERKTFSADLTQPAVAILQVMDYPAWRVHRNGQAAAKAATASSGQLQIALPAGHSEIDLRLVHTLDRLIADGISVLCLLLLAWVSWRERHHDSYPGHRRVQA
jgi:hypothetical protein